VLVRVPLAVIVAVEPQELLLALTWKLVGAVAVMFATRFVPVILKLVDDPGVPDTVEGTVVVPPGATMVGVAVITELGLPEPTAVE
jgi:hypothetical protein